MMATSLSRGFIEADEALVFPGFFAEDVTTEARELLWALAEAEDAESESDEAAGSGAAAASMRSAVPTHKRVWNLIEKGAVFRAIAEEFRAGAVQRAAQVPHGHRPAPPDADVEEPAPDADLAQGSHG